MRLPSWAAPLILALGALALQVANDRAQRAATDARSSGPGAGEPRSGELAGGGIARFVPEEYRLAAVTIEYVRQNQTFVCVPSKGRWLSYTAFGAPLVQGALNSLVGNLLSSHGVRRSSQREPHASYGFAPPVYRITLHGRGILEDDDRDILAAFEIGSTVDTAAGAISYARRLEHDAEGRLSLSQEPDGADIWEIDFDPRPELERDEGSSMPPMLDERLVPGPFPGEPAAQFRYLEIAGQSGTYRLVRHEVEDAAEGQPSWRWTLEDAEGSHPASWSRVETYCAFLRLAPYVGLEDPQRAALYGIERPYFSLRGWPVEGEQPLEIYLGDPSEKIGGRFCLNLGDRLLAVISDPTAAALDPAPQIFVDESLPEPWSLFLQLATKRQAARRSSAPALAPQPASEPDPGPDRPR